MATSIQTTDGQVTDASSSTVCNNETVFKLHGSLKNTLINKLNYYSSAIFEKQLTDDQQCELFEENNKLTNAFNCLPMHTQNEDTLHVIDLVSDDVSHLNVSRSYRQKEIANEIQMLIETVGKFNPKTHNIVAWLTKYESYCRMCEWRDAKPVDYLHYLLDNGLGRIISGPDRNFAEVKAALIGFVDDMLFFDQTSSIHDHIKFMVSKLNSFKFTNDEKRYWLTCFLSADKIRDYYVKFADTLDDALETNRRNYYAKYLGHLLDESPLEESFFYGFDF